MPVRQAAYCIAQNRADPVCQPTNTRVSASRRSDSPFRYATTVISR